MKSLLFVGMAALFLLSAQCFVFASDSSLTTGCSEAQVDGITSAVVDGLWSRTDYWWHRGDYPRIIALDRLITEADPNFLEPYSNGGWLMESLGNKSDAEKYYRLGCTRNPNEYYLWFNLGMFYFSTMKDYPKAVQTFLMAVKQPDGGSSCLRMLAHSYEKNKQLKEAVEVWQKLQAASPKDSVIAMNLNKDKQLLANSTSPVNQ